MPKRVVPLTDVQVKNAKPKDKDYKLSDGFGLVLLVKKTGGNTKKSLLSWPVTLMDSAVRAFVMN